MSNIRCESLHWMTPLVLMSMLISFYIPFLERVILYLLTIGCTLAHWHYGTIVVSVAEYKLCIHLKNKIIKHVLSFLQVQQMCVHFNRICFKVTSPTNGVSYSVKKD